MHAYELTPTQPSGLLVMALEKNNVEKIFGVYSTTSPNHPGTKNAIFFNPRESKSIDNIDFKNWFLFIDFICQFYAFFEVDIDRENRNWENNETASGLGRKSTRPKFAWAREFYFYWETFIYFLT